MYCHAMPCPARHCSVHDVPLTDGTLASLRPVSPGSDEPEPLVCRFLPTPLAGEYKSKVVHLLRSSGNVQLSQRGLRRGPNGCGSRMGSLGALGELGFLHGKGGIEASKAVYACSPRKLSTHPIEQRRFPAYAYRAGRGLPRWNLLPFAQRYVVVPTIRSDFCTVPRPQAAWLTCFRLLGSQLIVRGQHGKAW